MLIENIKEAFQNLVSNRMRSVLTMLGIIIGIAAVITITTIGTSIKSTLNATMNSIGGNSIQAYVDAIYPENQEELELYLLEQTCINGTTYLLAAEEEEEDSVAYILKEVQTEDEDVIYAMVEDDVELNAISKVFAEMLDDVDIEM